MSSRKRNALCRGLQQFVNPRFWPNTFDFNIRGLSYTIVWDNHGVATTFKLLSSLHIEPGSVAVYRIREARALPLCHGVHCLLTLFTVSGTLSLNHYPISLFSHIITAIIHRYGYLRLFASLPSFHVIYWLKRPGWLSNKHETQFYLVSLNTVWYSALDMACAISVFGYLLLLRLSRFEKSHFHYTNIVCK